MLLFWNNWDKNSKIIFSGLLLLFVGVISLFIFTWWQGIFMSLSWLKYTDYETVTIVIDQFKNGIFTFPIDADAFISWTTFVGSAYNFDTIQILLYFIIIQICLLLALTVFSFLNNWFYYLGTIIVLFAYVFQQPNLLFDNNEFGFLIRIAPIFIFGGLSYFFLSFAYKASFFIRFCVLVFTSIIYHFLLYYFTQNQSIVISLSNYGLGFAIVLAIGFIILVSFEIVYGFVWSISKTKELTSSGNNVFHFIFIFILYIANLLIQFLVNTRSISFNILTIHPFIILIISSVLGIWGFRQRSVMFQERLPFYPFGGVIYLVWGVLCYATLAYIFINGNDPLLEVMEDAILYSHIGFGTGFFIYVALYFGKYFNSQVEIHKIVYTNKFYTFFTVYAAGALLCLTLFLYANMFPQRQFWAGYYNAVGDIYAYQEKNDLAKQYYKEAIGYEFQNHKSNYSLATLFLLENDNKEALKYFKAANSKQPSVFAYANISQLEESKNEIETILALKDGLAIFSSSPQLLNNLAVKFDKIKMPDSSFFYIKKAYEINKKDGDVLGNKFALLSKYQIKNDEKIEANAEKTISLASNLLANVNGTLDSNFDFSKFFLDQKDSVINESKYKFINNYFLRNVKSIANQENDLLNKLISLDTNKMYRSDLLFISSLANFYGTNPLTGLKNIDELQLTDNGKSGYYLNTIGLFYLKMNLYRMAMDVFNLALKKEYKPAMENKIIAAALSGKWIEVVNEANDVENKEIANNINELYIARNANDVSLKTDDFKYRTLKYRPFDFNNMEIGNIYYSIEDVDYKKRTGFELAERFIDSRKYSFAAEILQGLKKLSLSDDEKRKLNSLVLKYYIATDDTINLKSDIDKLETDNVMYTKLSKAIIFSNDTSIAKKQFETLALNYPFDELVMLKSADFFLSKMNDSRKAYQILLDGITINPYSVTLTKSYILTCLDYGIPQFASSALEQLKLITSQADYQDFLIQFEKKKRELFLY